MDKTDVTEDIIKEILENCNWIERIWVRLNPKVYVGIYRKGLQDGFNCEYGIEMSTICQPKLKYDKI